MDSSDHPTAETVWVRVKRVIPDISLGTVYRNLASLAAANKIRQIVTADGGDRFDKTLCTHAHFHCKVCNKVTDVELGAGEEIVRKVQDTTGNEVDTADILFTGTCAECAAAQKRSSAG